MAKKTVRVAVLVSGSGSNLQALMDAKIPSVKIVLVLSSNKAATALQRAEKADISTAIIDRKDYGDEESFQSDLLATLQVSMPDVICLAGYMRKLSPEIVEHFHGRILNIHPALLPKFGGAGMYGHHVHEAVLKAGEKESGCTVHLVDPEYDHGLTLAQIKVPVLPNDTPDTLAQRVLEQEHKLYPKTLKEFIETL